MSDAPRPLRQTESARLADVELLAMLAALTENNETITVRAVIRRMSTLSNASGITRDRWRRGRVEAAVAEQGRLRQIAERSNKQSRTNVANRLEVEIMKSSCLELERTLALGGMLAAIQAHGELGGMAAWLKFFELSQPAMSRLRELGAVPTAEIVALPLPNGRLMARIVGKNGQQIAEEHVQTLVSVLASYDGKPLPRYHGELNRSAIAERCGFDRKVLQTNPRCAELIASVEADDRRRHLDALARAELGREDKAKVDRDRAELESQNLRLMAENASLKVDLERFRRLERLMADTGSLP